MFGGGMRARKALAVVLLSASFGSCATHQEAGAALRAAVGKLPEVNWALSPGAVIERKAIGAPVVWIGQVREFTYSRRPEGFAVEWICDHLRFLQADSSVLGLRPVPIAGPGNGRFLVNLEMKTMTEVQAEKLRQEYGSSRNYIMAVGTIDSIVQRSGQPVVFLYTHAFELSSTLVSAVE